jgi:hypothetical protein
VTATKIAVEPIAKLIAYIWIFGTLHLGMLHLKLVAKTIIRRLVFSLSVTAYKSTQMSLTCIGRLLQE